MLNKSGELNDIVLYQIQQTQDTLSVRAQNSIQSIINSNPASLFDYVYGFEQVISLRNVGKKTQAELNIYFENIKSSVETEYHKGKSLGELNVIKTNLGVILKEDLIDLLSYEEIVKNFFNNYKAYLSNRVVNAIESLLNSNFQYFLEYVYSIKQIKSIRNIGNTTVPEIESLFISIRQLIDESKNSNEDSFLFSFKLTFSNYPKIRSFFNEVNYSFNSNQFPIYSLYKLLLSEGYFLKKKQYHILSRYFGLFGTTKGTRSEIASELSMTRERVRQLVKQIKGKLEKENIQFINKYIKLFDFTYLENIITNDYFFISNDFVDKVNILENYSFTSNDIEFLTGLIINNSYVELDACEIENMEKMFIRVDLMNIYRFRNFISDFHQKSITKYIKPLELNFEGYLYSFLQSKKYDDLKRIVPLCEEIIFKYFGKLINVEGNIVFEGYRNDFQVKIREIFQEIQTPLKVKELETIISKRYPELKMSELKLRSILQRFDDFEYIGRSSTYFLKDWENEKTKLKGGSIRDIVIKLLVDKKKPLKTNYVVAHVLKYRKSNRSSILTNLKVDSKKRFIFSKDGMIDLRIK